MKSQQQAMVWPYFKISPRYNAEGYRISAFNKGTGPAIIESVQVLYKGKPMQNANELLNTVKPDRTIGYDVMRMNNISNSVLQAGETQEILFMPWNEEVRAIVDSFQYVKISVCYKSVLGDYWTYHSDTDSHEKKKFKALVEYES